jgi:hypothetical protein
MSLQAAAAVERCNTCGAGMRRWLELPAFLQIPEIREFVGKAWLRPF